MKVINNFTITTKIFVGLFLIVAFLVSISVIGILNALDNTTDLTLSDFFANRSVQFILILDLLALVIGIWYSSYIARSITRPTRQISNSMMKLAYGDQNRNSTTRITEAITDRKDEVGALGRAFIGISDYMIGAVEAANRISTGDLSHEIKPFSDKDELGIAFKEMSDYLSTSVKTIAEKAAEVNASSIDLADSAHEAGEATSQIAVTIQQVAKGTSDRSASVNTTVFSVEQMTRAIEGIASGAQEQSAATNKASEITSQLSGAIDQVAGNVHSVVQQAGLASEAARLGSVKVHETLDGMQEIKRSVDLTAQKIQTMGKQSDQIGEIVDTIEDIASQTNLLALNAAIEAARAGEAGKGFAVVADEVRKLAERVSTATKDIGDLIKSIQKVVAESVTAMDQGVKEVDKGVLIANEAGSTLDDILKATQEVNQQAEEAAAAAEQMAASANEMVSAVDSVSAVVEENTASTEQMSAGSMEVSKAMENIAAISEENSAAVQQVSASAEEMSSHVARVSGSASALAELATHLQDVVMRFKLV